MRRLRTATGALGVEQIVIAAGVWTNGLLRRMIGASISPRQGQLLVTEESPPLLRGSVLAASYLTAKYESAETTGAADRGDGGGVADGGRPSAG